MATQQDQTPIGGMIGKPPVWRYMDRVEAVETSSAAGAGFIFDRLGATMCRTSILTRPTTS
jgi:hypothetical protein